MGTVEAEYGGAVVTGAALLIPGGRGQVGFELSRLTQRSLVHAPGSRELDITDEETVTDAVDSFAEAARDARTPPVVVNLAAYTAVDAAESDAQRAGEINTRGAELLARACRRRGVPLVHVSTDYVFAGAGTEPYEPDDVAEPRTVYGRTKLDGERAVLESAAQAWIVRSSWIYGARGKNFVKTLSRLEAEHDQLSVVDDQIGSPTWAADLAAGLLEIADQISVRRGPERSVLHCTNSGQVSWFEFAQAVFDEFGAERARVQPCPSSRFPRPAARPAYSVLSERTWHAAGLTPLRSWRAALSAAFAMDSDSLRTG